MTEPITEYHGIDVSHHQSPNHLPWEQIRESSQFVIARATYGISPDREAENHIRRARQLGLTVGLYHFFRPSESWERQIEIFAKLAGAAELSQGDLLPAIDIERDPFPKPGMDPSPEWNSRLRLFAEVLVKDFGGCLLYLTRADWVLLGRPEWVREHFLWAVHWRNPKAARRPAIEPAVPDGMHWAIHQYGVGTYDAVGGIQEHARADALDHNRARILPRIPGPGQPALTPTLRPLDLPRIQAAANEVMTIDWEEFRQARDRVILGD